MNGTELLAEFRKSRAESAFGELVRRYTNLVYSVAKRRLGNVALAQEVTQTVFIRLARAVPVIGSDAELAAWLHRTTVHASIDQWRSESRRRAREERALAMQTEHDQDSAWNEVSPLLDEILNQLNDGERQVILLRFFEHRSMRELGQALGISEDAAKMRVSRAMEHLRGLFGERGVACATAGNCAAGGVYDDSTPAEHVFVAVQANGAWANAQQLTGTGTRPTLSSASCATPGNCAFGGSSTDASGHLQGFVTDLSAGAGAGAPGQIQTTTSVALSAATVAFGREQAGQISVTVAAASGGAASGGAPRGVVTVTANKATVCLIILGSGTGSCRLTPKGLRPGRYALTARFFGGLGFAGSASAPATLTVTR